MTGIILRADYLLRVLVVPACTRAAPPQ